MKKSQWMIVADYSEASSLTLESLCEICEISSDEIYHLVAYDILYPAGRQPEEWVFDQKQLQRAKTALRLQRDLEINLAGVALVLDLLEDREELRAKLALFEKHYT